MLPQTTTACRYRKDFVPELDGLRAIAALLVLWVHLPRYAFGSELDELHRWIAPGAAGVDLFFVLSGFLITRILLVDREQGVPLRLFLIRRSLRIFPIYYLTILIVGHQLSGFELAALLTYTANFALLFTWGHCPMDHAWSLAVEEHFYLLWPPIAVFLPPRTSRRVILFGVLPLALVSTVGAVALGDWDQYGRALHEFILRSSTTKCFSLGLGALVAYHEAFVRTHRLAVAGVSAALVLVYLLLSVPGLKASGLYSVLESLPSGSDPGWLMSPVLVFAVPCASLALVLCAVAFTGSRWPHCVLLRLAPLRAIGRISYGLYLYHFPIFLTPGIWGSNPDAPPLERVLLVLAVCFGVASLSYLLIERPLLRIGARFRGKPRAPEELVTVPLDPATPR